MLQPVGKTSSTANPQAVEPKCSRAPGAGSERERLSYTARWATGLVTVGDLTGAPDLAAISRAGR